MVSKLGYRKDSPYKNRKSLTIDSNHITMKDVEFPLLLVPNNDNPVIAKPGEEYMFNNSRYVKEYRLKNMKYGGQTEELLMAYMAKMKPEEQAEFMARFEELGSQEKKMLLNSLRSQMHEVRNKYEEEDYMEMEDEAMEEYMYGGKKMQQGGIYIDPAKRGTFKAQATRMGMGVQQAANQILSNKEDYSPAMVKKANFARNAANWKKEDGGMIEYGMGGELPAYQSGGSPSLYDRLSDFSWSMIGPRAAKSQSLPPPEPTPAGPPSFYDRLSDFSWSMMGPPGKPQALPPEPTPEEYFRRHEAWRQEELQKPRGWVYREEGQPRPINPYTKNPLGFEWSDEQKLETGYYDEVEPRYGYIPNKNSRGIPKVIGQIPPSDPRSSTGARKAANLGVRDRAGLFKEDYSEKGQYLPQVDYGDFTDPLNPRKSQWAPPTPRRGYKEGGQLPEYQPGGMAPINPYTKQPLGMVWSDEEKLKTGYYDEIYPQYNLTSKGITKRSPSDPGSATSVRRAANKIGTTYNRMPTGYRVYEARNGDLQAQEYDERGILRPAVNYGDFTDPLNTRFQMTKFKKGGQLPEYQLAGMAPSAAVTDTNRPLNPNRPIGWDEKVLTAEQSSHVDAFVARGDMSRAEAIDLVTSGKPYLPPPGVMGGPGALSLLAGAGTTTYLPLVSRGTASGRAVSGRIAMGTTSERAVGASAAGRATGGSKALPPSTSTPLPPLRPDTKALPPSTSVPLPQLPQVRPGSTSTPPPQFRPGSTSTPTPQVRPGSNPAPGTRIPPTPGTTSPPAPTGQPPVPVPPYRSTPTSAPSPSSTSSTFTGVDLGLGMVGAVAAGVGVSNARRSAANPPQATMTSDMAGFLERQGVPGYRNPTPGMMASQSVRPSASAPSMGQPGAQQVPRAASTSQASNTTVRSQRPSSASIQGDEYVIQRGDTLSQIARRAGIPMEDLARLNNIQNVNMIRAGSTLRLRPQQTMQAPEVVPQRAPVEPLDRIALRNPFDGPRPPGLPAPSIMPSGQIKRLEAYLPEAMQNVSRAMAQEPKKRRFSNRRTR